MNVSSAVMIGGASSEHARNEADFYPTPPECTQALCDAWLAAPARIWEPACGDGAICRVLERNGHTPIGSDLHARGYGTTADFLCFQPRGFNCIVTNPPFALAEEFIRRARGFGVPFAMLLKATYWHAATRQKLFRETGPSNIFALTWRPNFAPDRGKSPTMDVIWTTWAGKPRKFCAYRTLARPSEMPQDTGDIFA